MKSYKVKVEKSESDNIDVVFYNKKTTSQKVNDYGLDSVPLKDGEGVVIDTGSGGSSKSFIGGGGFKKKDLKEGEVVIYNNKSNVEMLFSDNGKVDLKNKITSLGKEIDLMYEMMDLLFKATEDSWKGVPTPPDGGTALKTFATASLLASKVAIDAKKATARVKDLLQ